MKKKDLLKLPSQKCPKIKNLRNLPYVTDPVKIKYLLTAQIHKTNDGDILKATLFSKNTRRPVYLIFCDKEEQQFCTYDIRSRQWRKACLHNLVGVSCAPMRSIANVDDNVGAEYFKQKHRLTSNCILDFQFSVRSAENQVGKPIRLQYENGHQFLESIMQQAGSLPSDIYKFIDSRVLPYSRYFYYKREKDKITGYCSHCRTVSSMPLPKEKGTLYNKTGKCPNCHSKVWFKPQGRACQLSDESGFEYIQRIDDGFLIRSFYVERILPKDYKKKYSEFLSEDFRTFISYSGRRHDFFYYRSHFGREEWVNSARQFYCYYQPHSPGGVLYTKNLNRILKGTRYQYCQIAEYGRHVSVMNAAQYLQQYVEMPCIEYLVKLKMYRLLKDTFGMYGYNVFNNSHGKNPAEVFGIPKADVKTLIRLNVNSSELKLWSWCKSHDKPISEKDIKIIQSLKVKDESFSFIHDYFELTLKPVTKLLNYLKRQLVLKNCSSLSNAGYDWIDYIKACKKLEYDLTDENTLRPRNLHDAHDKATALVEIQQNRKHDTAIRKQYLTNLKKYGYKNKDFLITVPSCAADLISEGQKMHHCVATYLDRVAENKCTILFLRNTAEPDKPFVTAEIRKNRLIQIRAKNNAVPSEKVKEFWKEFETKKLKAEKSKSRKAG